MSEETPQAEQYWKSNIRYLIVLLSIWAFVSLGCGVLFADWLDQFKIGGAGLGFWFAQQGSMLVFVVLIFVYVVLMNRLDKRHEVDEE